MDKQEQKAVDDIEKFGCHVIHVLEEEDLPGFTYSIGIYASTGKPDMLIMGLKREVAHSIINEYNKRVKSGEEFVPNSSYGGFLEGFDVVFKKMDKKFYKNYLGWGLWFYKGDAFEMLQMVFPTTSGIWPWEEDAPEDFLWFQPLLTSDSEPI
ncbi:MAG: hypothetical protein AMJ53_11280 [Gammaproteobacteria bacterium SG8_11]|nr:MAG: hypothetical protein AMJ53_11280 [Gammaproteobacteria bacterium SG8_11]